MSFHLYEAASRFFRGPHRLSSLGNSTGSSGSVLARLETNSGSWCLRGWPPGFEEERLRFVHWALLRSRDGGFSGVPKLATTREGETVLNLGGRLFDAQEWLPGEPLSGEPLWNASVPNVVCPLKPAVLSSLTGAVARFHGSTAGLKPESDQQGESVFEILAEVSREAELRPEALCAGVLARPKAESRSVALRWLELLPAVLSRAESGLRRHLAGAPSASTLCHGDLWAPHVHFDGRTFAGLVDFESLCFGSPAFDLAQLILHLRAPLVSPLQPSASLSAFQLLAARGQPAPAFGFRYLAAVSVLSCLWRGRVSKPVPTEPRLFRGFILEAQTATTVRAAPRQAPPATPTAWLAC